MNGKPYNVCLLGAALDTGNQGVSALSVSLIKLILEARPEANIALLIGNRSAAPRVLQIANREIKINIVNYRLSPRAHLQEHLIWIFLLAVLYRTIRISAVRNRLLRSNRWLQALAAADFIGDIYAGDSFSDIYGLRRFLVNALPSLTALLLKKKLVLLPQTYGPYKSGFARLLARFIIRRSIRIFSRDPHGREILQQTFGEQTSTHRVEFCPDVAFTLESRQPDGLAIHPPLEPDLRVPLIGLNVNGLMYNGGYTRHNMFGLKCSYKMLVQQLAKKILEETAAHILLVPHTFGTANNVNSDPDACREIFLSMPEQHKTRLHLVSREYDQYDLKGIIGLCDFFVGSRMHACIAALSQGIPTVGIAYSQKFKGIFQSAGVENMVIDARVVDAETAILTACRFWQNRDNIKGELQHRVEANINRVRSTFQELLKNDATN